MQKNLIKVCRSNLSSINYIYPKYNFTKFCQINLVSKYTLLRINHQYLSIIISFFSFLSGRSQIYQSPFQLYPATSKGPRHTEKKRYVQANRRSFYQRYRRTVTLQAFGDAQRGRIADWTSDYKRDAARRDATQSPVCPDASSTQLSPLHTTIRISDEKLFETATRSSSSHRVLLLRTNFRFLRFQLEGTCL